MRWTWWWVAACGAGCAGAGGSAATDPKDSDVPAATDTPAPVDSEVDTTTTPDSPADTEPPTDTEPPVDTDPWGSPSPPTDLGVGFVHVTEGLWDDPAWRLPPTDGPIGTTVPVSAGDLDGDGTMEVFVGYLERPATDLGLTSSQVFHYRVSDHSLVHDVALTRVLQEQSPHPITGVMYLDDDGRDDLLRHSISHPYYLADGAGGWIFGEFVLPDGFPTTPGPGTVAPMDLDNDGWLDLLLTLSDCTPLWPTVTLGWRTGPRTWTLRPEVGAAAQRPRMNGAVWAPVGGELTLVGTGNACDGLGATTGSWRVHVDADGPTLQPVDLAPVDALFRQGSPIGVAAQLFDARPGGAAVLDLNRDGWLDVLTAAQDADATVLGGGPTLPLADWTSAVGLAPASSGAGRLAPGGAAVLDADGDGQVDLAIAYDPLTMVGAEQPPRLLWGDGAGGLHDLTTVAGLSATPGAWRAITTADLDGDLAPDLLVGGAQQGPAVLHNELLTGHHRLGLRLHGTTSNHLGIGAVVEIVTAAGRQARVVGEAASTDVLARPELLVGLGSATEALVRVRWPSGLVQEVPGLAAGAWHTVEEPPTVTLSAPDRRAPADGASEVTVTVQPRSLDGAPRVATQVAIELEAGTGTWAAPPAAVGTTWQRTLIAPTEPGSAVVRVTVDGQVWAIRPRVWWGP